MVRLEASGDRGSAAEVARTADSSHRRLQLLRSVAVRALCRLLCRSPVGPCSGVRWPIRRVSVRAFQRYTGWGVYGAVPTR